VIDNKSHENEIEFVFFGSSVPEKECLYFALLILFCKITSPPTHPISSELSLTTQNYLTAAISFDNKISFNNSNVIR
jgi:hypothetical protein